MVCALFLCALATANGQSTSQQGEPSDADRSRNGAAASVDVPLDDWTYAAIERLQALGYINSAFVGLKPWTRSECARLVQEAEDAVDDDQALPSGIRDLLARLRLAFAPELGTRSAPRAQLRSVYSRTTVIAGEPLTDSYHFGQTVTNDFGRPYAEGFNQVLGFSGNAHVSRFAFNVRAELQHAPDIPPLGAPARQAIGVADGLPMPNAIAVDERNRVAILDASAAFSAAGLQFTVGKQSLSWGPTRSGSMILSNNAAPIYMLAIDQVHPMQLPSILAYLGPVRFHSFFGHLEGHHFPGSPFFYGQKISLKPTPNLEFGFSRTVVFAGQGVTPLTFGTFAHSFFSVTSGTAPGFDPRNNPGVRHGSFDFSYRLPGLRRWGAVLYADSVAHDDVSPISAPRRASINPGIYIARMPAVLRVEFRAEAVSTDPPVSRSNGGKFLYWENLYRDAYTNDGTLMGTWIGREAKGGQAWITTHVLSTGTIEASYRRAKLAKDFISGGGTQNDVKLEATFPVRFDVTANASVQVERWSIPVLSPAARTNVTTTIQLTWSPGSTARK